MMKKIHQKLKLTSEDENVTEMQTYGNNGEQNKQEEELLTTNFEVKS